MALALNLPSLLRFPDDVKVVLEAFVTTVESESRRDLQNKRILAIVSHKDEWDLTEEGA
jgi:phosphatidylinositol-bisphosphatase